MTPLMSEQSLWPLLRAGRWVILLALAVALLPGRNHLVAPALRAGLAASLLLYTLATLALLRPPTLSLGRVAAIAAADVMLIGTVVEASGGLASPFFGLYHLVITAAAITYGVVGGLIVTGAIFLITAAGEALGIHGRPTPLLGLLAGRLPELPTAAIVAGYLSTRLRAEIERRHESERAALVLQVRQESLAKEMALAREVQQAALPRAAPRSPEIEIAVRFRAAAEVGGDFYDFYEGDGRVGLLLGDAAGKGVAAALVATTAMHTFHTWAPRLGPAAWCAEFGRELAERAPDAMLASAIACEIDLPAGTLHWVNAGHPPPVLARPGAPALFIEEHDLILGIYPNVTYEARVQALCPGDLLLFYTDGVSEAARPDGSLLGAEFLLDALPPLLPLSAAEIVAGIEAEVLRLARPQDDLTLLVLKKV
jgi:sigma-B regulation protein RsbU (phosphoserine phosphatase)